MPNRRSTWSKVLLLLALCALPQVDRAIAQTPPSDSLKSEIYFGSRAADGQAVGEQAWEEFVAQVIAPRFPAGLTILDARGRSGANVALDRVRVLVLVHPNSPEAQARLGEIKAEFRKRFGAAGVFHTDQAVRVHAIE